MGILYVACSAALNQWGAEVGLGRNLFKVGYADVRPEQDLTGVAGQNDWKAVASQPVDGFDLAVALARLARKEKLIDPGYYPHLKGAGGIVKVNLVNVENSLRVRLALENRDVPRDLKVKPVDSGAYLLRALTAA